MIIMKNNLYVIYIGGRHQKSLIEIHDIRFVVANNLKDTYQSLKNTWWGTPSSLHIDAWGILNHVDGYDVVINNNKPNISNKKLYFIYLGGYDKNEFAESHKTVFIVADDDHKAKIAALKQIRDWKTPHRDNQYEIDQLINISDIVHNNQLYLHLSRSSNKKLFNFECKYIPIK